MFWPKKLIVKNLNSRIIPEKAWKSGFFPVHSQYPKKKKNTEQFTEFKEF